MLFFAHKREFLYSSMYGTSPCSKAILGFRKFYNGFLIHASREFEALKVYRFKRCEKKINPGKADT